MQSGERFGRPPCDKLCTWPTIGTEAKKECKAKQNLFNFDLKLLLQVFFFFKLTGIRVETSFDRVKTQTLLKLITIAKPIMSALFQLSRIV